MKTIILTTFITLFTLSSFAQINKDDLAISLAYYQKNKTTIIKQKIKMSTAQAQVFWPLYDQYEGKRNTLTNERAAIINDYLNSFNTLTGQEAIKLTTRVFANDKSFTDLQKSYFKKFCDAIGGVNASKFYQLENYITQIVRLSVQDEIPFIGETTKQKKH